MEHKGLVSRVEEDLERAISLGRYPRGGLPSERVMAKRYGVSRTTIRGALHGLAARGLIIKHPGRQSSTVGLDQALTLESLKLVLPEEGREDPARRRLLEGFFSLKREVTVELLAACCEYASKEDLDELVGACFALREEAHWREDRRGWVHKEFELLRLAARAADRPGHALLVQSLEKAFRGLSNRVLPHLDAAAIEQWALFAFGALVERNAQALRSELPALLAAVDARLIDSLAPVHEMPAALKLSPASEPSLAPEPLSAPELLPASERPPASEPLLTPELPRSPESSPPPEFSHPFEPELPCEEEALSGADRPNRYACHTSSAHARPTEGYPPQDSGACLQPVPQPPDSERSGGEEG